MAIYMWREPVIITTPWIYHNSDLWLISLSSDGSTRYTIADKNIWATTVYNDWDTLSQNNCGKYYQWGNNYWFPFTWSVSTSSSKVNASNYWPWNYYSSSTFITINGSWDSSDNNNLRWWITWTNAAMQWPCDSWFHLPLISERNTIYNVWVSLWLWSSSSWNWAKTYLKIPMVWYRNNTNATVTSQGTAWNYWSSSPDASYPNYARYMTFSSSTFKPQEYGFRCFWYSIRPFKNEAVQPDDTWTKLN